MTQEFDPYYYFLGIPRKDQPPDHYRLLGVERFEPDDQIIEMAANRQMAHLQRHESGAHVDEVARLLNEVARARLCLLNDDKRAAYDAKLRSASDAGSEPQPKSPSAGTPPQNKSEPQPRELILESFLEQIASNQSANQDEFEQLHASLDLDRGVDRQKANILFQINDAINAHKASVPGWRDLFVRAISHHVLADMKSFGEVDDEEGNWLVDMISGDKQLDANELALLAEIKSRTGGEVGGRLRRLLEKFEDKLPNIKPPVDLVDVPGADSAESAQQPVPSTPSLDWPASNIVEAAAAQIPSATAAPTQTPSVPDQAKPQAPVLPAFESTYKRPAPKCFFCGERDSSAICAIEKPMYGNVRRVRTAWNTLRATWDSEIVKVPRCIECLKHHQRFQKTTGGGLLLGLIMGAVGFLSILAMGPGGICVGLSLAAIGATVGAVVGYAIARSETPYKMRPVHDVASFERIHKSIAQGWKRGKKPSQLEQQNAPIVDDASQPRTLPASRYGGGAVDAEILERSCPNCGTSSYTMQSRGTCPNCHYADRSST